MPKIITEERIYRIYSTTTRFAFCLMVWKLVWEALPQGMSFSLNG